MGQALKVIKFDSDENLDAAKLKDTRSDLNSAIVPLRISAIFTAILGVISLILEVKIYFQFRYEIYLARLFPTILSLIVLILLQTNFGKQKNKILSHLYLFFVLTSVSFVGYKLPHLFLYNLAGASLFVMTLSLFLHWGRNNQIAAVAYFILLFGAAAIFSEILNYSSESTYLIFSVSAALLGISIVASGIQNKKKKSSDVESVTHNIESDSIDMDFITTSPIPLFKITIGGQFVYLNNGLKDLLNIPEELVSTDINFFDYVVKNEKVKSHLLKKIENKGKVDNYRLVFTNGNGGQQVLLMDCKSNIIDDSVYLEGSLRDITVQYKQDKMLRAEIDELKQNKRSSNNIIPSISKNEGSSSVISKMGHELRTPMNSVLGFLTLIENGLFENDDELKEFSHSAKLSAESLLALINDIVELSKLMDGTVEISSLELNVKEEINKITTTLNPHLELNNLSVSVQIDESVPENIISDPSKYCQVVTNLLRNAIHVSEGGEIVIAVSYQKGAKGNNLITKVKDSGNGIAEDDLYKMLNYDKDSFDKESKIKSELLHIMIAKEITALLEGNFSGKSEIGQGTEFSFEIQVDQANRESDPNDNNLDETNANHKNKSKLLLVEDNPISRKVEQKLLREAGYDVDCVDNAPDAIEKLQNKSYDLVLMDIELKGVNGLEATQKIRLLEDSNKDIPIIAVTAHSSMKDREKCLMAGMNDYISKPINITFLKMTIDQWISRSASKNSQ